MTLHGGNSHVQEEPRLGAKGLAFFDEKPRSR